MNIISALLPAFAVGLGLGLFFFIGLWWTVEKGLQSPRPALWFFASFICRTGVTLFCLYWLAGGDWQKLIASLVGFIVARFLVTRALPVKNRA